MLPGANTLPSSAILILLLMTCQTLPFNASMTQFPILFSECLLATDTANVHLGPYTAITDATCSRPVLPKNSLPSHTPYIEPTAKLVSTIDDPSSGSNATD